MRIMLWIVVLCFFVIGNQCKRILFYAHSMLSVSTFIRMRCVQYSWYIIIPKSYIQRALRECVRNVGIREKR
jgi:hypothetical protein